MTAEAASAAGAGTGAAGGAAGTGAPGDFDFLVGSWDGRHRRLRKALAGCDEWDEFTSTTTCWPAFGGAANIDEITVSDRGFAGLTVRLLDPVAEDLVALVGEQQRRPDGAAARHRLLHRRRRPLLLRPALGGPPDQVQVHLVRDHAYVGALGPGVLCRRRADLGDQLDHLV